MIPKRIDANGNGLKYDDWVFVFNQGGTGCETSNHDIFIVPRYGEKGFLTYSNVGGNIIKHDMYIPSLSLANTFKINKRTLPKKFKIMVLSGINIFTSNKTTVVRDEEININNYQDRIDIDEPFENYKRIGCLINQIKPN